jgi:Arc/MetJ-type ribon-helix-helix transcriptional regulator
MNMVSIVLPQKMSEELDALISLGYYDNRSEIVREALRNFLSQKPEVRLVAAIKLYKDEKITISRAAEIAGVSFDEMKNILIDEGIIRRGKKDTERSSELEEMVS